MNVLNMVVKAVDTDNPNGEFEAILSTEVVDREGESIKAGAFDPLPASIPIYHSHDWRQGAAPVARAVPFYDGPVLKVRGVYASTVKGQEMRALVTEGIVDSMSVGFSKGKASKGIITKGELLEASFTAIPVNPTARVLVSKAGARNSAADLEHVQSAHDHMAALGATCTPSKSVKSIVGTLEAVQDRVRDALEDAYGPYNTYLRGVDPAKKIIYFDRFDGDTFQQTFTDDGAVVTLEGDPVEVDVHEIVVPDADADREQPEQIIGLSKSATDDAAAKAAAPPAAEEDVDDELAIAAQLLSIDAFAAAS